MGGDPLIVIGRWMAKLKQWPAHIKAIKAYKTVNEKNSLYFKALSSVIK